MRLLFTLLVCLLTIYAPVELTRVIVINELIQNIHPEISPWQFIAELVFLWVLYAGAMALVYRRWRWLK